MPKPITFELQFSGYQNLRIEDGEIVRPATAEEAAHSLRDFLQSKCDECQRQTRGKMRFTIKRKS